MMWNMGSRYISIDLQANYRYLHILQDIYVHKKFIKRLNKSSHHHDHHYHVDDRVAYGSLEYAQISTYPIVHDACSSLATTIIFMRYRYH